MILNFLNDFLIWIHLVVFDGFDNMFSCSQFDSNLAVEHCSFEFLYEFKFMATEWWQDEGKIWGNGNSGKTVARDVLEFALLHELFDGVVGGFFFVLEADEAVWLMRTGWWHDVF